MSNVITFSGRLTRDSEVRSIQSGSVLNFDVATNTGYGDKQKTMFIRCAVWGKRAESNLSSFLLKGTQVMVSGELGEDEYKANDGTMKKSLTCNANIVDLMGSKQDNQQAPAPQQYAPPAPAYQQPVQQPFNPNVPPPPQFNQQPPTVQQQQWSPQPQPAPPPQQPQVYQPQQVPSQQQYAPQPQPAQQYQPVPGAGMDEEMPF